MSTTTPRKKPDIKFNDKSYQSWLSAGKSADDFHGFGGLNRAHVIRFFNSVDLNKAPLRQYIETILRIRQPEFNDDGEQIGSGLKEWVYYTVEFSGKDQWSQRVNSGTLIEGQYQVIPQEPQVKWELVNGTPVEHIDTIDLAPITKYNIPFSKDAVDTILMKHNNEDRKDDINYVVKFSTNPHTSAGGDGYGGYSYDEFVSSEWDHLRYLANTDSGSKGNTVRARIDTNKLNQVCNCSKCTGKTTKVKKARKPTK